MKYLLFAACVIVFCTLIYDVVYIRFARPADTPEIEKALRDTIPGLDDTLQQRQGCIACDTTGGRNGPVAQ